MENNNISYSDLVKSIEHWNEYRVPILRISQPEASKTFQGAMRFYFQDAGQKVATKCVNVKLTDSTKEVIDVLIEKFRPDMRMLSVPEYGLYEIHENGDERKLAPDERPLLVQLEWNKDDREGRFLLRRMDEKTRNLAAQNEEPSLKRKLSKKERKKQDKLKKQHQKEQEKADAAASKLAAKGKNGIAQRLYNELPETSFTRSISNPEAVMKRRRAQKLQKPLHEFSLEGGQEAGGTLRIFGETINKDVSYKTLLLSTRDTAAHVVKQILEKYGKEDEDPNKYCLVKLIVPSSAAAASDNNSVHDLNAGAGLKESILADNECPLLINQTHDKSRGILTFHIRPKPADYAKRCKRRTSSSGSSSRQAHNPLHPVVQQLNQRIHNNNNNNNNNNIDQFRDQNSSPQNSSQTSGSINHHDMINPPPPAFDSVNNGTLPPAMYPPRANGNGMMYYAQQPHSISTLPPRINQNHNNAMMSINTTSRVQSATMQRQPNYNHPSTLNNTGHQPLTRQAVHQMIPPPSAAAPANSYPQVVQQQQYIPLQHHHPATGINDQILPALIQVKEDVEDIFLSEVITNIIPTQVPFRLAPTYVLYMVSRYRASTLFHPELQAPSRAELFMPFTRKIATMIRNTIETHAREPVYLAFWLANSSDLGHFYKQDKHLSHFTIDAQEILYDSIKASFKYLLSCKQLELDAVLQTFFDERDDDALNNVPQPPQTGRGGQQQQQQQQQQQTVWRTAVDPILDVLAETMATMRKNRVNAALTIQIFSHLFHHISKWLFDRLIGVYDNRPGMLGNQSNFKVYCNRIWGERLYRRLAAIGNWAEKQGLEQAADFHLARVTQVTLFLAKRYTQATITPLDLRESYEKCDRLNPVQARALLSRYQPDQPVISRIIENLLYQMDYTHMASDYPLEEDFELKIPFLIPEDGYSSEHITYIPNGLLDFVSILSKIRIQDQELCIFTVQPTSSGHWTVYFKNHQPNAPEHIIIQLRKKNSSMGLSIIAARGVRPDRSTPPPLGIYIKNVVKNGAASMDGRLQAGDQLLEVDGQKLENLTQEQAAELMKHTGSTVTLKIAKQAAIFHKVDDIINSAPTQTIVAQPPPQPQVVAQQSQPLPHHQHHHTMQAPPQHKHHHQPHPHAHQLQPMMPPPQAFVAPAPAPAHIPPPPSVPLEPMAQHHQTPQPASATNNPMQHALMKSPKKVSWVDTQPHQSLHTLIPLAHEPDPPTELLVQSATNGHNNDHHTHRNEDLEDEDDDEREQMLHQQHLQQHKHQHQQNNNMPYRRQPQLREDEEEEEEEEDDDDDDEDEDEDSQTSDHHLAQSRQQQQQQQRTNGQDRGDQNGGETTTNGLADTTAESLTLEDIDEVLSSKQTNNWLEDSAGVIGTQEVYNDPRQRIVKERERTPQTDVNIEKLSFQEKLKMFNLSAKK